MKKVVGKIAGLVAICLFIYPIWKMTITAMDNDVNLYPVLMVISASGLALLLSKKKNNKKIEKRG